MLPKRIITVGILCVIVLSITLGAVHGADEAASMLERAEAALASSYQAVADAEKASANVTALLRRLNDAGLLLSKAYLEYQVGNSSESTRLADNSYSISSETTLRAKQLKDSASSEAVKIFLFAVAASSASIGVIVLSSVRLWRRFKRWYQARDRELVR